MHQAITRRLSPTSRRVTALDTVFYHGFALVKPADLDMKCCQTLICRKTMDSLLFLAAEFAADAHSPMNVLYRGRIEMW